MVSSERSRDVSSPTWAIGLLVLLVGGGAGGAAAAASVADAAGLTDIDPVLIVPVTVTGIALGGLAVLALVLALAPRPWLAPVLARAGVPELGLGQLAATAIGVVLYLIPASLLAWLAEQLLGWLTSLIVALLVSVIGLPGVGPLVFRIRFLWSSNRRAGSPPSR